MITTPCADARTSNDIGVYLHWNGGRDSVEAFLTFCKLKEFRPPETDSYGWARLCQVVGNYFGTSISIGIDRCDRLDCDNWDNGVYIIRDWKIVDRQYQKRPEQQSHDLREMLDEINKRQPEAGRLEQSVIDGYFSEQNISVWMAITQGSQHQWTEDEIYRLNGQGALYYTGGEDGIYVRIESNGMLEAGNYEGATPHIGEAMFTPKIIKEYDSYSAAVQAVMEAGGKQFMTDMFSGSEHQPASKAPQNGKPSLRETLAENTQKSKEMFGDQSPAGTAPQIEETL